jgi:hypothetical protein
MEDMWKFDGSMWDFLEYMLWYLVVEEAKKRGEENIGKLMITPELIRSKGDEYGITFKAIAYEMVRIGGNAVRLLELADKLEEKRRKESESESE